MTAVPGVARPLSPTRAELLGALRAQTAGTSLGALAALTGLHANTLREHLSCLVRDGLARREQSPRTGGRGRPAWLYFATQPDALEARHDYAGLAATLASVIERRSPDPPGDARRAGNEWGRVLASETGVMPAGSSPDARRKVVDMHTSLGFEPQADEDASVVRLTRCPMLEAAHRNPRLICSVHLGVVTGAMTQFGGDGTASRLDPFAQPGACVLRIRSAAEDARSAAHEAGVADGRALTGT